MPKAKTATEEVFVVGNPYGVPAGVHILSDHDGEKKWYEGDEFVPPASFPRETVLWLLEDGIILPAVRRGGKAVVDVPEAKGPSDTGVSAPPRPVSRGGQDDNMGEGAVIGED